MKYFSILFFILLIACNSDKKNEGVLKEVSIIPIDFEIIRFDKAFGTAKAEDLPMLKKSFPEFFPKQFHDSIWVNRMNDTLQQQLMVEVLKKFPKQEELTLQLKGLFQHIKYYFPEFNIPNVYTNIDFVDYRNKVILSNNNLIISLDTYLGENHPFYEGIPVFLSVNMKPSQILPDVAEAYAKKLVSSASQSTFLAQMIYFGKILYLKELWLPESEASQIIGYSTKKMDWVIENESEIWSNFIENEYLFSTQPKLVQRFISPAPFSKFYLEIDNESPGRIGTYIGWQIVKSFMKKNEATLQQLMMLPADEIFNKSKYKPKK